MPKAEKPAEKVEAAAEKPIDYNEPVKVMLTGADLKILVPNELNGSLPPCTCHGIPENVNSVSMGGGYWHRGQVILMRRGEAFGEPNEEGVMRTGRNDVEAAPADAEPYVIPGVGPNGPGNETPITPPVEQDIPVIDANPPVVVEPDAPAAN